MAVLLLNLKLSVFNPALGSFQNAQPLVMASGKLVASHAYFVFFDNGL